MDVVGVLFAMVLIGTCVGTLSPSRWLPAWLPNDKVLHAGVYFLLSLLVLMKVSLLPWGLLSIYGLFMLGFGLEIAQRYIPGRGFSIGDVAANGVGIAMGVLLYATLGIL